MDWFYVKLFSCRGELFASHVCQYRPAVSSSDSSFFLFLTDYIELLVSCIGALSYTVNQPVCIAVHSLKQNYYPTKSLPNSVQSNRVTFSRPVRQSLTHNIDHKPTPPPIQNFSFLILVASHIISSVSEV
jgi:hypothetical protein